jgi:hypothetical protein
MNGGLRELLYLLHEACSRAIITHGLLPINSTAYDHYILFN